MVAADCWKETDSMNEKELHDRGMKVRREVLGAEYADKAVAAADDFNQHRQEYVTKHCRGAIWTPPGLPRKMRSMLNLAMLAATGHPGELKRHLRGAIEACEAAQEVFTQLKI
jgi:4-carboxymuconolactone decarboxylase